MNAESEVHDGPAIEVRCFLAKAQVNNSLDRVYSPGSVGELAFHGEHVRNGLEKGGHYFVDGLCDVRSVQAHAAEIVLAGPASCLRST